MANFEHKQTTYIYIYSYRSGEESLCALEMRSLFGKDTKTSILESDIRVAPSRSPFIKERIEVLCEGNTFEELLNTVETMEIGEQSFRVTFVKNPDMDKVAFSERRKLERQIGLQIQGEVDLKNPDISFGIMHVNRRWVIGKYEANEAIWLRHQQKPNGYSTALSTRLARAVVNIAVPEPLGLKVIDPCCGIGTVLVEALSMGIHIDGSDRNPLILPGARENIAFFGYKANVVKRDVRHVTEKYDVAIIDLPYNLCSVITPEEQLEMMESARRFAKRLVVVTIEPVDPIILEAGFKMIDRGIAKKGNFIREILVCE